MKRSHQGILIISGCTAATSALLAMAVAWNSKNECVAQFPKIIGCAIGSYENLSGGLIAASGALFAGWLAWSATREQIQHERDKAAQNRAQQQEFQLHIEKRTLAGLERATDDAKELAASMQDDLGPNSPYANRLYESWEMQTLPQGAGDLTLAPLGMRLWEALMRVRSIAQQIHVGVQNGIQNGADELRAHFMAKNEARAKAAIDDFAALAAQMPALVETQRAKVEELSTHATD